MKIDLPITIIFDCQNSGSTTEKPAGSLVCTLRYDIDDLNVGPVLCRGYPPREDDLNVWEPAQAILAHIDFALDARIKARAARSPWDYMVGTETERTIAQEEADEQRAQDGP